MSAQMDFIYSRRIMGHMFSRGRACGDNIFVTFSRPPRDIMAEIWGGSKSVKDTVTFTPKIRNALALYVYFASGLMGSTSDPFKLPKEEKAVHRLFLENINYLDIPIRTEIDDFGHIGDYFATVFYKNSAVHSNTNIEFAGKRLTHIQTFWGNMPSVHFSDEGGYRDDYSCVGELIEPQTVHSIFQDLHSVSSHFANNVFSNLNNNILMNECGYSPAHPDHGTFYRQDMFNLWILSVLHYQASAFMRDVYDLMR